MPATAGTAAAVDRRMARSMLLVAFSVGSRRAAAANTDMGSSSRAGWEEIWEAASGANRPEPLPTGLNWSL